jgi:hypothetical protein
MQPNMLDSDKVFTSRNILLHRPFQPILLPTAPTRVLPDVLSAESRLHHLCPISASVVGFDVGRRFGDVDEARAGVFNEFIVEELEAELVASLYGVGRGIAGGGTFVAAEV